MAIETGNAVNNFIAAIQDLSDAKKAELLYTMFDYTNEVYRFRTKDFTRSLESIESAIDKISPIREATTRI